MGFCLYDIYGLFTGYFNYISYLVVKKYANSEVSRQVIWSEFIGQHDNLEYGEGIIVDRTTTQAIARVVRGVFAEYGRFSNGASRAGKALCFDSHFNAILSELLSPGCSAALENA